MIHPSPLRRNIELKARCPDIAAAATAIASLSPRDGGIQVQIDTYFTVPHGRLKLREIVGQPAMLIWYDRANQTQSRKSDYLLIPISEPAVLKTALAAAVGIRIIVKKSRRIFLWENVRIHLDDVANLGTFIEFEAVVDTGESESAGHDRIDQLCRLVSISPADLLDVSYGEL